MKPMKLNIKTKVKDKWWDWLAKLWGLLWIAIITGLSGGVLICTIKWLIKLLTF